MTSPTYASLPLAPGALCAEFRALSERRARRDETGLFALQGARAFMRASADPGVIRGIIHCKKLLKHAPSRQAIAALRARGVPVSRVGPDAFRALTQERHASGVLAIARMQWLPPQAIVEHGGLWLGVRHVQSAGNLGTMCRSAEALGARGLVLLGRTLDVHSPQVVRASMGGIFGLGLVRTTHWELGRMRPSVRVLGADATAESIAPWEVSWRGCVVALMGHERHGLTPEESQMCEALIRIPMAAQVSSINVAMAANVLMYEALRQRGSTGVG